MADNGMTLKRFLGNNTQDILLEEDSTFGLKEPRNTTDYSDPTLPGNRMPVPTLTEPKKTFDGILNDGFSPQSKQSFTALDPGVQMPSISSIKSSLSSASAAAAEGVSKEGEGEEEKEAEWKDLSDEYQTEPGDVDVGGKKNKTRRKSNKKKRSIKRKPKY